MSDVSTTIIPTPLPYHRQIVDLLRHEESELWRWYAGAQQANAQHDALRLELLKSTYRLDQAVHGAVYAQLNELQRRLGLDLPATLYQAHGAGGLNAGLWFTGDEIHLVLHGPLLTTLAEAEIAAVFAHELGHFLLWRLDGGAYAIADRMLDATVAHPAAEVVHHETARRWRLHTELFADRVSLSATGDRDAVVRALVRIETGGSEVDASAYLTQAREALAKGATAAGRTHPDCFIRALAVADGLESDPVRLVGGPLDPLVPDLLDQRRLAVITAEVLNTMLAPDFMRSEAVLAHARQFFPDFTPVVAEPASFPSAAGDHLADYLCHLLLGVACADRALGDPALGQALLVARRWGREGQLVTLIEQELKRPRREVATLSRDAERLVAQARVSS